MEIPANVADSEPRQPNRLEGSSVGDASRAKIRRLSVEYNLTEHCNLSCYACDHASPLLPKRFASIETFSRDLQALAQVFHSQELRIVGGEPLLHPRLIDFLTEARRIGIADNIVLYTNGVLLDEVPEGFWDKIDRLKISAYPGVKRKLDDEKCADICKAHNVRLQIRHIEHFEVITINNRITDIELVKTIYRDCKSRAEWSCHTVHEGRFYKCPVAPFTGARLALRGVAFDNIPLDGIALPNNPNLYEELCHYLSDTTPLAACSYCLGSSGPSVAHRQLNHRGRLAWLGEDNSSEIETARAQLLRHKDVRQVGLEGYRMSGREGDGIVENLIFDVGAHRGEDTDYYLRRGFRVVAVECAPAQIAVMRSRFESELRDGRLTLIERAIAPRSGPVTFYQNNTKSVWGTAEKTWADRNIGLGTEVEEIMVNGIQAEELFHEFGIPYYLKADVEGRDLLVVRALESLSVRPPYLSLEAEDRSMPALREEFTVLRGLGYDRFKLSPQHHVGKQRVPAGSLQGRPVIWTFEDGSSGLFGEDLAGPWLDEEKALKAYEPILLIYDIERAIKQGVLAGSLKQFLSEFGYELGWYDTHARHGSWSGRAPRARFGAWRSETTPTAAAQEPSAGNQHSIARTNQARRLMGLLSQLGPLSNVAQECERCVPGVDEVPEWQVWTDRGTTSDQRQIEEHLETLIHPSARLLHIGAGNSSLGSRFAPRVEAVLGTTIHDEERLLAESLGLANYSVVVANKYSKDMDQLSGHYDFIIDNNPASFACCLFHFARMLVSYVGLLRDGGLLLTAELGMRWVVPNNDPNWALSLDDWQRVGEIVGMPLEALGASVYGMRRSGETGSKWRGGDYSEDRVLVQLPANGRNADEKDGRMARAASSQGVGSGSLDDMREQLREAIRAQERLQDQLRAAASKFSHAIAQQQRSAAVSPADREFQKLESRLSEVEQCLNGTSEQVQAILQSRIWRTLVKMGGVLLRFQKLSR